MTCSSCRGEPVVGQGVLLRRSRMNWHRNVRDESRERGVRGGTRTPCVARICTAALARMSV